VTLRIGQAIEWPRAAGGIAQIQELRRLNVRIVYLCRNGRVRYRLLRAADAARRPLLFQLENPLNRGVVAKSKTFRVQRD
jgi:hypothetical protein